MKLSEFICLEAVRPELQGSTKKDVILELIEAFAKVGEVDPADQAYLVNAIMRREELGTTAIVPSFAIPHIKHPMFDRVVGTIGIHRAGVDFNSMDGRLTEVFILLLSPVNTPKQHLRALETVSRHLENESFCRCLRQCRTAKDVGELLCKVDTEGQLAPV